MNESIIDILRKDVRARKSTELAEMIGEHLGGLRHSVLVTTFKEAFPEIPLSVLLELGQWHRVGGGTLSDDEFNERLLPWCGRAVGLI